MFLRGQGRLLSEGTITSEGLQPNLYTAERTSDGRHEAANFDWESGVVLLNDNKTAGLELPTFDPLAALWQFYFSPPENDDVEFNVATTRRVYHARFHRVGAETINLTIVLEVGPLEESVSVVAQTPILNTSDASLGLVVDQARLEGQVIPFQPFPAAGSRRRRTP